MSETNDTMNNSNSTNSAENSDNGYQSRNPGVRLFAREFNDATHQFKEGDDERSPKWTLLPTGITANRIFVVGTLTETEETENGSWRARVVDNSGDPDNGTGSQPFYIYAHPQYQPDAHGFLRGAEPPEFVAVVGKPNVYDPDDSDDIYVSISPEEMNIVDKTTRDAWVIETANHTLSRIERFINARENGELTPEMQDVIAEYGSEDLEKYKRGAENALRQLKGG